MVECAPFQGWRFAPSAGQLAQLVAPPYDVISPEEEAAFYAQHPHNIIRLERSRTTPADSASDNAYTRARGLLEEWCATGVLVQDPAPAFYVYEQEVVVEGKPRRRLGFLGLVKLVEPNAGEVFFHEHTFPGPREDRLRLLQAVEANISPIFGLFTGPHGKEAATLLRTWATERAPDAAAPFRDEQHRLWRVDEPAKTHALQAAMREATLVIADGHHRYEAAYAHRERSAYVMMCCSWLEDPGLVVFPIHRIVKRRPPGTDASAIDRLERCGEVRRTASIDALLEALRADSSPGLFGYYANRSAWLLRTAPELRQEIRRQLPLLGELDVTLLHKGIFPRVFGASQLDRDRLVLDYTPSADAACSAVDQGEAEGAWLLRPIAVSTVERLARQRIRLPQKSTYFYPKLLTGLVLNCFSPSLIGERR